MVLSACETGLGEIQSEGVYGLQRAFKLAGAEFILMSLWQVEDEATGEFMAAFYLQFFTEGLEIRDAFWEAQRIMRDRYPNEPYKWAGFILVE